MTPEERLDRIEKALDKHIAFVGEAIEKQNQQIEKQNEGIKGLIVVARTCLDSFNEVRASIQEQGERNERAHDRMMAEIDKLREAQTETAEKLKSLVETVDRIIRSRENGKQQ